MFSPPINETFLATNKSQIPTLYVEIQKVKLNYLLKAIIWTETPQKLQCIAA